MLVPRGDTTKLSCPISSASSNIDWAKVVPGPNSSEAGYDNITENCRVKPEYTSLYEVSAADNCDLVIVNASKPHGGRYVCYVNGKMSDKVSLSVLETNVTGSQTSDDAVGGDIVNYTCQILYYGDTAPSLRWTPYRGDNVLHRNTLNESIYWEVFTVSVQIPDGPATFSQTCRVADWDANWSRVYFWTSAVITVSYCPKNVKIEGAQNGSTVDEGTELKCVGQGHPPPSYLWTNAVDNTTVEGDTFTVGTNYHELTCTATTNISFANGTIHTCSDQVYFEVNGCAQANMMIRHGFPVWIAAVMIAVLFR